MSAGRGPRAWRGLALLGLALPGLGALGGACVLDELGLEGKGCDPDHACPSGLVCVLRPVSATERAGTCQPAQAAFACQPDAALCPEGGQAWAEVCEQDGHSTRVSASCEAGASCNPDTGACALGCAQSADCLDAGAVCDAGTGLCRPGPACAPAGCPGGGCVGRACVPDPAAAVTAPDGAPQVVCFATPPPAPPASPAACSLGGRVSVFPLNDPDLTPGLFVRLRQGRPPWDEIATTQVTTGPDANGVYEFADLPTNQRYLLEIEAGQLSDGAPTVTTLHPAVDLRADLCAAGQLTRTLVVLRQSAFASYTSQLFEGWDERRGLLLGRVQDCSAPNRQPLGQVTAGTSLPPVAPGTAYYFAENPSVLVPDLSLAATTNKGYYAVAGLPACDNTVGFRARVGATPLDLGEFEVPIAPAGATLLDLPLPETRLPE
ncbi:MAG TPA: hypothetical protein PK668_10990 [Myxococcota bacterium]|nr:hypothetical protein [Myxococcota bacterium]HRY93310.1 hypothetical protein [Myxococcota bacterium]HSA19891.1 hypothetical protein [Myxococcota bacterium]